MKAISLQYRDGARSFCMIVEDGFDIEAWTERQRGNFDLLGVVKVEVSDALLNGVRSNQLTAHAVTESATVCPLCGTRTQFMEQYGKQLHWCLSEQCQFVFTAENDDDGDEI